MLQSQGVTWVCRELQKREQGQCDRIVRSWINLRFTHDLHARRRAQFFSDGVGVLVAADQHRAGKATLQGADLVEQR